MPLSPLIIASIIGGGASVAGGALANRSNATSSTTPTMDPKYGGLQQSILDMITKRLSSGPADLSGYTASGIGTANKTYGLVKQAQTNDLTSRGLATSPIAGVVDANRENARAGDITRFQNSIPLLQRDLQTQDLGMANSILSQGRGVTTTQAGTGGGGPAGAFENLAAYLGYLQGKGVFGRPGATPPLVGRDTVPNVGFLPVGGTGFGG